jgi:hypothetical protein
LFFKKKKEKKYTNLKGKVQCNEDCVITLHNGEKIHGRINELNWVGFIVDFIDGDKEKVIQQNQEEEFNFIFKLPREFGHIEVSSKTAVISKYSEMITNDERIKMVVNVEGKDELKGLQDFINYRNRRFARHAISRKSIVWMNQTIFLTFIYIVSAILVVAVLFSLIYKKFF